MTPVEELKETVRRTVGAKRFKYLEPWIDTYGEKLLAMEAREIFNLTQLLLQGEEEQAYKMLLKSLSINELKREGEALEAEMEVLVKENAAKVALQKRAMYVFLGAIMQILLVSVGF